MIYEHIQANKRKSFFLLSLFFFFLISLGYVFDQAYQSGGQLIFIFGIVAFILVFSSYYYSHKLVLAISRAKLVQKKDNPYLVNTVEGLAIAAGIPMPRIHIIEDTAPNAFATGRNPQNSAIVVTSGLLQKLNRLELEGVIAHEMSHIKNYDIRYATLVAVLVGTVALFSDWMRRSFWWGRAAKARRIKGGPTVAIFMILAVLLSILAPLVARLIQTAISRQREYLADSSGALLTRYPEGLALALEKIAADTEPLEVANKATAHLYIVNPLIEHRSKLNNLFSTHPPIEERIKRLRAM